MKTKKAASIILKIVVSGLLIGWIFHRADTASISRQLAGCNGFFLLLTFLAVVLTNLGQVLRWYAVLPKGGKVGLPRLLQFHMISIFFQSFLPSTMTVDLIKGYLLSRELGGARAYGSVAFGKIVGMLVLALFLAVVLVLSPGLLPPQAHGPATSLFLAAIAAGMVVLFSKKVSSRLFGFLHRFSHKPLVSLLMNFRQELYDYRSRPGAIAWSVLWSVVIFLASILMTYLSFLAVGYPAPFLKCLVFLPLVYALMLVPVSINGIGLREGLILLLFTGESLTPEILIASSILVYAAMYSLCLMGGVVYVFSSIKGVRHGTKEQEE